MSTGDNTESEIFRRLNELEGGLREHVSSCTERRLREEDWHVSTEQQFGQVKLAMKESNQKIDTLDRKVTEINARYAVIVGVASGIVAAVSSFIAEWLNG